MLIKPNSSSHWYSQSGAPRYGATLREARKENLLPSVTTIMNAMAKPGLDAWKLEQAIISALTLPKNEGEPLDTFAKRIVTDMQSTTKKATDFGTEMHAIVEAYFLKSNRAFPKEFQPYYAELDKWASANIVRVIAIETTAVNVEFGYAGKLDLKAEHQEYGKCILDFKTQNIKGKKPVFYSTWPMQLSAYRECEQDDCHCLSVIINSNKSDPFIEHFWTEFELNSAWRAFVSCIELWQYERGYKPMRILETIEKEQAA